MKILFLQVALSIFFVLILGSIAFSVEIDESIILWLQFDDDDGKTAVDSSIYGNDGVINNCESVEGKYGSALRFDGSTSFVEVADHDSL